MLTESVIVSRFICR